MMPLDQEARRLVSSAAQRVSIVTAVSPRALIDVLFVFAASLRLIRQLARLYGGRPGAARHDPADGVMSLRMSPLPGAWRQATAWSSRCSAIGIAAKLSQRLGEGVLNGLLTARLGLRPST